MVEQLGIVEVERWVGKMEKFPLLGDFVSIIMLYTTLISDKF